MTTEKMRKNSHPFDEYSKEEIIFKADSIRALICCIFNLDKVRLKSNLESTKSLGLKHSVIG